MWSSPPIDDSGTETAFRRKSVGTRKWKDAAGIEPTTGGAMEVHPRFAFEPITNLSSRPRFGNPGSALCRRPKAASLIAANLKKKPLIISCFPASTSHHGEDRLSPLASTSVEYQRSRNDSGTETSASSLLIRTFLSRCHAPESSRPSGPVTTSNDYKAKTSSHRLPSCSLALTPPSLPFAASATAFSLQFLS